MPKTSTQQEISYINGQPIPQGEMSDGMLVVCMIAIALVSAILFAAFGGNND